MAEKRKDDKGRVLKEGEYQRSNGTYEYRWRTEGGRRNYIYAKTLTELRDKVAEIQIDRCSGIRTDARNVTVNDLYVMWKQLKKGLKNNTFIGYQYMYEQYVRKGFGEKKVQALKKSDIRRFYNHLADDTGLKIATIDNIHTVLHQVLDLAVEDDYIRKNPADNALKELKQARGTEESGKRALTLAEQRLLMDFLSKSRQYNHWKPIITVMTEMGLRAGEATGLRWEDIDLEEGTISVNHTLIYYNKEKGYCSFGINTTKTEASNRVLQMTPSVKEAFLQEKEMQELLGISCKARIDGYTGFIFLNKDGSVQHHGTINKALQRIIRDCNEQVLQDKDAGKIKEKDLVLLPRFSCHTLRHTCATRMCETGVNLKVIQDMLGHASITTTMNIYAKATQDLKRVEIGKYAEYLAKEQVEPVVFTTEDTTDLPPKAE